MDYYFYNTDARSLKEPPRPRYRVLIEQGLAAAGGDRQQFGEQLNQLLADDILLMYENMVGVVAVGRVKEQWDGASHTTPLYYMPSEMGGLTGGPYEYRIAVDWFLDLSDSPIGLQELRSRLGYTPRGTVRRIVEQRTEASRIIEEKCCERSLLPGDVTRPSLYVEGAMRSYLADAYERSHKAVSECKAIQGSTCIVCGFDFGATYGEEFAGFIHIHHLRPLSEIRDEYAVDPARDLCPLCPNCHAVVHYGGRLRTPDEVRLLLEHQRRD